MAEGTTPLQPLDVHQNIHSDLKHLIHNLVFLHLKWRYGAESGGRLFLTKEYMERLKSHLNFY